MEATRDFDSNRSRANPVEVAGIHSFISNPITADSRFYRLRNW